MDEEFEQHRQMVRQFRPRRLEAAGAVGLQQIDHRAAALAALAVDMLEEVERQRARTVEKQHEAFLQVEDVALGQLAQQRFQRRDVGRVEQALGRAAPARSRAPPPAGRRPG